MTRDVWTVDPPNEPPRRDSTYFIRRPGGSVQTCAFALIAAAWYLRMHGQGEQDVYYPDRWSVLVARGYSRSILPVPTAERHAALEALCAALDAIPAGDWYDLTVQTNSVPQAVVEALARVESVK